MRISDWSSDVCSSDLGDREHLAVRSRLSACQHVERVQRRLEAGPQHGQAGGDLGEGTFGLTQLQFRSDALLILKAHEIDQLALRLDLLRGDSDPALERSEEHTSELQSLMRISYAVFCL